MMWLMMEADFNLAISLVALEVSTCSDDKAKTASNSSVVGANQWL